MAQLFLRCIVSLCLSLSLSQGQVPDVQRFSARQCTAVASLVAQRCIGLSTATAASACTTYCASSAKATPTATRFCSVPSNCSVGTTVGCDIIPQNCTVTLSVNASAVNVGCQLGNTNVNGISFSILDTCNPPSTSYYINQQVTGSTNGDFTPGYFVVTQAGVVQKTNIYPANATTQTIAFTLQPTNTLIQSNTVQVTFNIQSCKIQIEAPAMVTECFLKGPGYQFPNLIARATNVPAGVDLIWDLPSNLGGLGATTAVINRPQNLCGDTACPSVAQPGPPNPVYSPTVIDFPTGTDAAADGSVTTKPDNYAIFTVNFNANLAATQGVNQYGNIGYYGYGVNTIDGFSSDDCQNLTLSASPRFAGSPYQTGSANVLVCYTNESC